MAKALVGEAFRARRHSGGAAGHGRLELFEYIHPQAIETEPTRPNKIGMHRVAFSVDDIDADALVAEARAWGIAEHLPGYVTPAATRPCGPAP